MSQSVQTIASLLHPVQLRRYGCPWGWRQCHALNSGGLAAPEVVEITWNNTSNTNHLCVKTIKWKPFCSLYKCYLYSILKQTCKIYVQVRWHKKYISIMIWDINLTNHSQHSWALLSESHSSMVSKCNKIVLRHNVSISALLTALRRFVRTSKILMVVSQQPMAICWPSGRNTTQDTGHLQSQITHIVQIHFHMSMT